MFLVPYILTNTWIFLHPSWVRWLKKNIPVTIRGILVREWLKKLLLIWFKPYKSTRIDGLNPIKPLELMV